jgi:hypothetical protein
MLKCRLLYPAIAIIVSALPAYGTNFQVGGCVAKLANFGTIQAAVNSVPAGSTILVCPGTYAEQVVISKPLTLRGQVMIPKNVGRPVIVVPRGVTGAPNLNINVNNIQGTPFAAQVLVQGVNPVGKVSVIGITIDGSGGNLGCSSNAQLAGLFFASGTSGNVNDVTAVNQQNAGCGFGIWVENGAGPNQTISLASNSVHHMDNTGIVALSDQNPPTLAVIISANSVNGNNTTQGIATENIGGTVKQNVVTGGAIGVVDVDFFPGQTPGINILANTIADVQTGPGIGIAMRDASAATSNNISNVLTGFYLQGGSANPGPALSSNVVENTATGIAFNCTANTILQSNVFNDSLVGFDKVPSGTSLPHPVYNIDTLQTGSCP